LTWQSGRNYDHAAIWPDFCVYFLPNRIKRKKPQKLLVLPFNKDVLQTTLSTKKSF